MEFKAREYQREIASKGVRMLCDTGILYLAMEVRTGKTFTSLMVAHEFGAKKVLFLTKKMAISGIKKDIKTFGHVDVDVFSIDSAHKADGKYDLVIVDEAHSIGSFPKPSKRAQNVRKILGLKPLVMLSGTPNPESMSQLYHQFWVSARSPWAKYRNFYAWAKEYVDVKERLINGNRVNDYSKAFDERVRRDVSRHMLSMSQSGAGFQCSVNELIEVVKMSDDTQRIISALKKNKVLQGAGGTVLGDTPVKLMSKVHQLCSGSVKNENGDVVIVDDSKAKHILERFAGQKIAIMYKYKGELKIMQQTFGNKLTEDLDEFNSTDKWMALQIRSGSEGVNLSKADAQVFFNIDFSAKDYIQARARQQTQQRESCDVYFLFSDKGIERDIYRLLQKKEDYTLAYFIKSI